MSAGPDEAGEDGKSTRWLHGSRVTPETDLGRQQLSDHNRCRLLVDRHSIMQTGTQNYISLSPLSSHFPGGPALAGTRMSSFGILWELRVNEVVATNAALRRAKAPVKSSPPTNQHPVFFTGRMPFLSPNQQPSQH